MSKLNKQNAFEKKVSLDINVKDKRYQRCFRQYADVLTDSLEKIGFQLQKLNIGMRRAATPLTEGVQREWTV